MSTDKAWKDELLQFLRQVTPPDDPRISSRLRDRAARRIVRGVTFLRKRNVAFLARTRALGFCMLHPDHDVFSGGDGNFKRGVLATLLPHKRSHYGFSPPDFLSVDWWDTLYTLLWREAGKFLAKRPELGVR